MSATRRTAAVASLFLLAACGGPREKAGTPADTTAPQAAGPAPAPAPADSATAADTTKADTASVKRDSAMTKPSAARPKPPEKPVATAKPDTSTQTATNTDTASQTAVADAPLRDAYHQAPRDTVSPAVYDGWKQFNLNCARCHGEDVSGTTIAPHLILSLKPDGPINSKELFISTVCSGRPAKGMPAWCSLGMEIDKIQDIYLYVKGRSDAKIAPGRPAVKSEG